ncbi:MAG: flagellar basal body-associated FliL family protein [Gaiellaceae bacterium]
MKHKRKLKFLIPVLVLLVVAGVSYKLVLAPKASAHPKKIDGTLVSLGDPFVVNLAGGHYGKLSVSVLLTGSAAGAAAGGTTGATLLPQYDAVRSIVTDELTGAPVSLLTERGARHGLLNRLERRIKSSTDEPITRVLITDLAVQ